MILFQKIVIRTFALVGFLFLLFFTVSCAHHLTSKKNNPDLLKQQVEAVWHAKKNAEWGTVYENAVSAYQSEIPRDTFIRRANVHIVSFKVKAVKITEPGARAYADVENTIDFRGFHLSKVSREEWLFEDDTWKLNLMPTLETPFGRAPKNK